MKKLALIVVMILTVPPLCAEEHACAWVETRSDLTRWWVALCGKTRADLVDRKTFEQTPEQLTFWWKMVFAAPQKDPDNEPYDEMLQRVRVRCASSELQVSRPITYLGRETVRDHDTSLWGGWKAAIPGSYAEGLVMRVCEDANAEP